MINIHNTSSGTDASKGDENEEMKVKRHVKIIDGVRPMPSYIVHDSHSVTLLSYPMCATAGSLATRAI